MFGKHKLKIIFTTLFFLLVVDYGVREIALRAIIKDVVEKAENTDFVAKYFGEDYMAAQVLDVDHILGVTYYGQTGQEKIAAVFEILQIDQPVKATLIAPNYVHPNRFYYEYTTEICGAGLCPFDETRISEVSEKYYESHRAGQVQSVSESVRWGLIYSFLIRRWIRKNDLGEVIYAGVDVVDWPRNPFDVWKRQSLNSTAPYGNTNYVYQKNLVLDIETFPEW